MKNRWPEEIKLKAKSLRKKGYSYGQLTRELHVSKSTLHQWIRGIKRPESFSKLDRIRWAKEIQPLGALANKRKREEKIAGLRENISKELEKVIIDKNLEKSMLSMLYWAEGTKVKGVLQFANTDPRLHLLFITLLRRCYLLDENRFRIQLHLHYYHREKEVKKFWSTLLNIPEKQFIKIYRKYRSKERTFRRNIGGICLLRYNSVNLKDEIINYSQLITTKIIGQVNVPVA